MVKMGQEIQYREYGEGMRNLVQACKQFQGLVAIGNNSFMMYLLMWLHTYYFLFYVGIQDLL